MVKHNKPYLWGDQADHLGFAALQQIFDQSSIDQLSNDSSKLTSKLPHKFSVGMPTPLQRFSAFASIEPKKRVREAFRVFSSIPRWGLADRDIKLFPYLESVKDHTKQMALLFDALVEAGVMDEFLETARLESSLYHGYPQSRADIIREFHQLIAQHDLIEVLTSDLTPADRDKLGMPFFKTTKDRLEHMGGALLFEAFPDMKARQDRYEEKALVIDRAVKVLDILQWNISVLSTTMNEKLDFNEFFEIFENGKNIVSGEKYADVMGYFGHAAFGAIDFFSHNFQHAVDRDVDLDLVAFTGLLIQRIAVSAVDFQDDFDPLDPGPNYYYSAIGRDVA